MIRDAIKQRMEECGLTIYQVARMVEGQVGQRTVYTFLAGEEAEKDAGTEAVSAIMRALGMRVAWRKGARVPGLKVISKPKRGRRPRKEVQDGH